MEGFRRAGVFVAAVCVAVLTAAPTWAAGSLEPSVYLALGDSVAAGIGANPPAQNGYVPVLYDTLTGARSCGHGEALGCRLDLVNLAVPGATTTGLIGQPGQPSQLTEAAALLHARNSNPTPVDDVDLVTLDIGGNDVFAPVIRDCATDPATDLCRSTIGRQLQLVAANYDLILSMLRAAAAGSDTTIAVMTYYNPLPGCRLAALAPLADQVLEGGAGIPAGLNDIIRQTAQRYDVTVVETAPVIGPDDLAGDCLHPDDSGHADIAAAFADAVTAQVIGPPAGR